MKKILLLSAVLLGAVTVSQAGGLHLSIGLPLPPLPPLPGITITAPVPPVPVPVPTPVYSAPACPPVYWYGPAYCPPPAVVVRPPVVSFGFGYPYYGHYYRGGYYHGGYYRDGYHRHGRW